ncbi:mitochondrial fission factor-like isoform X2 [Engraulis encrasicolus]|uniref:mitochondrial fission factor-like isoform X2 n=1 Tax=Engraulis encrasicolus TaxID=184585 RepID=UPI002FD4B19B
MATQMFENAQGTLPGVHPEGHWSPYSESINQRMRVPDRIRVAPVPLLEEDQRQEERHAYTMHIPDKLALTDVPDLSVRPVLSKHGHTSLWEMHQSALGIDTSYPQHSANSPIRRSYSDQAFGRSPPHTPRSKEALQTPTSRSSSSRRALAAPMDPLASDALSAASGPGAPTPVPLNLLSAQSVLQAAKELGQQASQRLLQTVAQKYSSRFGLQEPPASARSSSEVVQPSQENRRSLQQAPESWVCPEEESGAAVEFIVLRRQLLKMSRRLAALERQNVEHKQSEMLLFSLMVSAVLLNGWLWMRR